MKMLFLNQYNLIIIFLNPSQVDLFWKKDTILWNFPNTWELFEVLI